MSGEKQEKSSTLSLLLKVLIWLGVIMFSVFIILPTIFILLSSIFPKYISSNSALNQLNDNINAFVGYCSLIVGVCSIIYTYMSNHKLDEQQQRNEAFLEGLSKKIDEVRDTNVKLYDQVVNGGQNNTKTDNSK